MTQLRQIRLTCQVGMWAPQRPMAVRLFPRLGMCPAEWALSSAVSFPSQLWAASDDLPGREGEEWPPQPPFHSSLLTACRVPHGHPTWKLENTRTADRVPLAENRVGKQWNRRERQSRFCKGYMLHNGEHVKTLLNDNSELQTQKSNMICMVGGEKTAEHVHSTSKCRQESKGTYTKLITDIWSRDDRKSKDFRMISNVSKIFKKNAHVPLAWFNIKSMSKYNHLICFYKIEMPVALAKLS